MWHNPEAGVFKCGIESREGRINFVLIFDLWICSRYRNFVLRMFIVQAFWKGKIFPFVVQMIQRNLKRSNLTPWNVNKLLLTLISWKQNLTFWMIRGVPKSEPPWSLKPQGWRSLLESLISKVPAVLMANYLPINVTNHSRYLSAIATYLYINLSHTVTHHHSSYEYI